MGVFRLLRYIQENDGARQKVQLAELAKKKLKQTGKNPKLVCDYQTIQATLLALQDFALIRCEELPRYSLLYGGNYQLYEERVQLFVKAFQQLGIDLVFFVDGPLGINEAELQTRLTKQKKKYLLSLQCIATQTEICNQKKDSSSLVWRTPQLASTQVLMTLRDAGAQIIICQGEADMEIAQYARSHVEVLGILSTDTDFSIMENTTLFPLSLNYKTLDTKSQGVLDSVVCEMVSPTTLASSLGLEEQQLPDLSILCGNDFTKTLNRQLDVWTELEIESTDVQSIAQWLKGKSEPLTKYQPMHDFLLKHPQYLEAVQHSYRFYSQSPSTGTELIEPACLLYSFMKEEIQKGCMVYSLLSVVKNGVYWRSVVRESLTLGHPSMHDLLLPVRKVMYALLGLKSVREFGRTSTHSFIESSIDVDIEDVQIIHSFWGMDSNAKMCGVFHLMVNAYELSHPGAVGDVLKQVKETPLQMPISIRDAIMCAALLFTVKVNDTFQPPHCFITTELSSLLVSCLTCCAQIPPHQTSLLPSMRAITLGSRFLYTLEHVYYLASVVGLGSELPQPKDLFYLMAFIPYHVLITHQSSDDSGELMRIRKAKETALSLEAVHAFLLAITSPDQSPKFSELVHLFSSAVKAIKDNRQSLDPDKSFLFSLPMSTRSEDSSQEDTDDEEAPQVPPQALMTSIGATASVTGPNQSITTSNTCLDSHNVFKPENFGLNKQKCSLPVFEHRDSILHLIATHKVVCIVGETGCGKSSQIPQYIIDDSSKSHICRILVSQPNHMAAKTLTKRVAGERNEEVGDTVGYCSEGEFKVSEKTLLTYCTTEYMLENLIYKHQDVNYYTHIILDEVHERSVDIDIIMLVIRKLALKFPDLKVVLMSATLQEDLFINYFQQVFSPEQVCEPYFVGMKRFPIDVYFIDEIDVDTLRMEHYWSEEQLSAANHLKSLVDEHLRSPKAVTFRPAITAFTKDICTNLIISQSKFGEGILVFLPSFSDLSDYFNELTEGLRRRELDDRILVFVFHGRLVPNGDQDAIFKLPPQDKVHVILSNKVAENSITIPNLRMVINFGINQNLEYDTQKKMSCLNKRWCSRSSCSQREGRVGRVFRGIVVHLFTRKFFNTSLSDFDAAEITKYSLAKTVLKAKQLGHDLNIPLPSQFLSLVIEPPSFLNFAAALQDLVTFGAVEYSPDKGVCEDTDTTLVGKFCLSLPLDLKLGRLVLFGIFFGCPFDAIVMAAALSMYQDVFTLPTRLVIKDLVTYRHSLKRSMDARVNFDNGYYSDPIMMCNMFVEWLHFRSNSKSYTSRQALAQQFAKKHSVIANRLLHFESLVGEIASHVCQFIPSTAPLYKRMQRLSQVVQCGGGMPHFEQPGTSCTSAVELSFKIPFCDDSIFLKALIAAASPNLLIHGKPEHESSDPFLRNRARVTMKAMAKDVQYDPYCTIAMEIEDTESDENEIDEAILQKLVNEANPTEFKVKLVDNIALIHFTQFSSVKLFWQFPEVRESWQIEGINAKFPMPFHPCCLTWNRLTVNREHANVHYFNWRNPTGFVCRIQHPNQPVFAVASEMIGTNDPYCVFASKLTILPQMPQGLLLLLAFQPISTNIELLLERENSRISAVRINSQEIKNTAEYINTADIQRINKLRKALSEAMICFLNGSTIPIDHPVIVSIPTLLQDVLNRTDSDLSNPPMHATTEGNVLQSHHPATVWETVLPGVDFSAVSQTLVDNNCSDYYPSFQCSLTGGQPHSVKEVVLSQAQGETTLHTPPLNVQCHSSPCVRELQESSSSIYVEARAPCDISSMTQPQKVLISILQSSLQPGSDEHIAEFFIKYLKENGGEVSIAFLSQVFHQTYLKIFRKQTQRPNIKLKKFFNRHPNFEIIKESNTGTRAVKLQKATTKSLKHPSPQPGSEQHMVEFCVQKLKQSGGEASLITLWRKYRREYRYNHHKHERILRKIFQAYPQYFILIKHSSHYGMEMVKLSGFIDEYIHPSDQCHKPRSYRSSIHSVPTPNLDQSHKPSPCLKSNWCPESSFEEYLLDIFEDFVEYNEGETSQCIFPSYCKYYKRHQKETSKPKMKFKRFFKTYFQITKSLSCVGPVKTIMLRKPTMRLEQDIVTARLTPKTRILLNTHPKRLSIGRRLYLVKQKLTTDKPPFSRSFNPGSDQHMVQYFVNYLKMRGGEASITSLRNAFSTYKQLLPQCQDIFWTRPHVYYFRLNQSFFKSHPKYFKLVQGCGFCTVKLSRTSTNKKRPTPCNAANSIQTVHVSQLEPVVKHSLVFQVPAVVEATSESVLMPSSSTSLTDHRMVLRLPTIPSSTVWQSGSKRDSRNFTSTAIQHHSYVPKANQDSKLQPSHPLLTKTLRFVSYEGSKPGFDQHMVQYFIDFLKMRGGEATITSLQERFATYLEMLPDGTLCPYSCKFFFKSRPKYFKLVQGCGFCTVKLSLTWTDNESLASGNAINSVQTVLDPKPVVKHSHVTETPAVVEGTSVQMPSSSCSTSDSSHRIDVKLQPTSSSTVCQSESEGDSGNSISSNIQPRSYVSNINQDSKQQQTGPLLTKALTSECSKPGSDQHMVQYFVDSLKMRGGEASITSLRKAFATYVEMLPVGVSCPYSYLHKEFFESRPKYFKLVQGCGFCTVKLSVTSTDNESLAPGNAMNSVQTVLDTEPVVKCTHATEIPAVVEGISLQMPSFSTSDSSHRIDVKLQPTSSSTVCQSGSEGDSGNSSIQSCSDDSEVSQDNKLQQSVLLLPKALTSNSSECSKPGSNQHMVQYFVDCLKKRGGEASITSLRKAFATYVEMLPVGVLCPYPFLHKEFFKSRPKYFKLVQGCGFCTVKLSLTSTDNENFASDNAVDSIQTVLDPEPVGTETPAVVKGTSVHAPSSSTSDPDRRIDVKLQPTSSSIVYQSGSEGDSGNSVTSIQPCKCVPEASQDSELQLSTPVANKTLEPGSDQHMVEFFVEYLNTQSGGKASITSLHQKVFPIYLKSFSNDIKKPFLNKKFFKSHPQYFELIEGDGFCTVSLSTLPPDEFRGGREDITKTAQSQCAAITTDAKPKVEQKSRGYPASATCTTKKSCTHSAKAEINVCKRTGRLPITEVPPGEKTTLDALKPIPSANAQSRNVKVLPASNSIQYQYHAPVVRHAPSTARQDKKRSA